MSDHVAIQYSFSTHPLPLPVKGLAAVASIRGGVAESATISTHLYHQFMLLGTPPKPFGPFIIGDRKGNTLRHIWRFFTSLLSNCYRGHQGQHESEEGFASLTWQVEVPLIGLTPSFASSNPWI